MSANFVFWPRDLADPPAGTELFVIGYRISHDRILVIDLLPLADLRQDRINNSLQGLRPLKVLGTFNFKSKQSSRVFEYDYGHHEPVLHENELLVKFTPPQSGNLEYYSLNPMGIDTFWSPLGMESHAACPTPEETKLQEYSAKLEYHFPPVSKPAEMAELLRYINLTDYSRQQLRPDRKSSQISQYMILFRHPFDFLVAIVATLYSAIAQVICHHLVRFLSYPFFVKTKTRRQDSASNDDENDDELPKSADQCIVMSLALMSHTCHQINSRAKQLYNLPLQFRKLRESRIESQELIAKGTKFSPSEYIKFYNTVWLIVNDVILGWIFSTMLQINQNWLVAKFSELLRLSDGKMHSTVIWLMNSPAGFKLNNELSRFFGELVMWVLDFWDRSVVHWIVDNFGTIVYVVAILIRYAGVSLLVAIATDLFQLLTFEFYGFYIACTRIYRWQWHTLLSLFRLFYGKKYNVLRDRVDSNIYEFDELMSGILIFTMLLYLMPTVAAFYLTFALCRIGCVVVTDFCEFNLICFNHLPLGVLLLRFKNKERLPAGVTLVVEGSHLSLLIKCLNLKDILTGHISSMLNFNLTNYNECYSPIYGKGNDHFKMQDVINNWKRIAPLTVCKKTVAGDLINNVDYKKMF